MRLLMVPARKLLVGLEKPAMSRVVRLWSALHCASSYSFVYCAFALPGCLAMNSFVGLISAALVLFLAVPPVAVSAATITVYAAASLKESMDAQARQFESRTGDKVVASYAASNALAKQIEAGAPADVFISADLEWMDYLDQRRLLAPNSRVTLLGNTLVLIAPSASKLALKIESGFALQAALGNGAAGRCESGQRSGGQVCQERVGSAGRVVQCSEPTGANGECSRRLGPRVPRRGAVGHCL